MDKYDLSPSERRENQLKLGKAVTWPEAGIIYCTRKCVWCMSVDTKNGECTADECNIESQEYISKQRTIDKKLNENYKKSILQKTQEKQEPIKIRRQTKTREEIITEKIATLNKRVAWCYKNSKPRRAERLENEIYRLQRELEK